VYPIKNNNNYTVSVPRQPENVTQRATSAKMHSQLTRGGFWRIFIFQGWNLFFLQGVNRNSPKLQGCKDILTLKYLGTLTQV